LSKIIVRLKGGLGNQLFIYAAAKNFCNQVNGMMFFDIHSGFWKDKYRRHYELSKINIHQNILPKLYSYVIKALLKFQFFQAILPYTIVTEKNFEKTMTNIKNRYYYIFDDYFQSTKYFEKIKEKLQKEVLVIISNDPEIQKLYSEISTTNSVCLHGRLLRAFSATGEKVSNDDPKLLNTEYFNKAIEEIKQKIPTPHFFVFSDNPKKMALGLNLNPEEYTLIEHSKHAQSEIDFWLMKHCKHFIISNSTYSWWAAYLAQNESTIVIYPPAQYWDNPDILNQN